MNNGKHDEAALLAHGHGVFQKTGYISFGNSESPLPYVSKEKDRDSYKGKQMLTHVPPSGNNPTDLFGKEHAFIGKDLPYSDRIKYAEVQKEKPGKGFGTSDFSKRDEFSNTTRTEQYRSQLKQEGKHAKKALDMSATAPAGTITHSAPLEGTVRPKPAAEPLFFDQVFAVGDDFESSSRLSRDTANPTRLSTQRFNGTYQTSSQEAHAAAADQAKSAYGRTKLVEATFYRPSNAFFPAVEGDSALAAMRVH